LPESTKYNTLKNISEVWLCTYELVEHI